MDPKSKPHDKIAPALKAAIALSSFYDKIPSIIRLPSFASGTPVAVHIYYFQYAFGRPMHFRIQTNLSSIHYHSLNILIHRPFLSVQGTPARPETAPQSLSECTRSAETLTLILKEIEKYYSLVSVDPLTLPENG